MATMSRLSGADDIDRRARRMVQLSVPLGFATVGAAAGTQHVGQILALVMLVIAVLCAILFVAFGLNSMRLYFQAARVRRDAFSRHEEQRTHVQ